MSAKIRGLTRIRDKEKVITTLTSAFTNYPKLVKAFPEQERRSIAVEATLRMYAIYQMKYGGAYSLNDECQGIVVLIHSSRRKTSKLKYLIAGSYSKRYKETLSRLTYEEQQKRSGVFIEMEEMEKEIKFPDKYLYVSYLGVKPEYQGQGNGRAIMNKIMDYGNKKGIPVVLFTNEPKGVQFYQNMGFKIIGITSSKKFEFINIYLVK